MAAVNRPQASAARRVAFAGVLGAAVLLSLFAATLLPTNRIFFSGLSSVFIAVLVIEFGTTTAWLFYAATSLLALVLIPDKLRLMPYLLILGHYGIWKTYIEDLNKPLLEIILKLTVLNAAAFIAYFITRELFFSQISIGISLWLLLPGLELLFLIYDYVFTLWIRFYLQRIRPHLGQ